MKPDICTCINSFACSKKQKLLKMKAMKVVKFDQDCRNISGTIKHCIDIQVKRLKKTKTKTLKNNKTFSSNKESRVKLNKRK